MKEEEVYLRCDTKTRFPIKLHIFEGWYHNESTPCTSITHTLRGYILVGSPASTCEVSTSNWLLLLCFRNVCRNRMAQINNTVPLVLHGLFYRWRNLCVLSVLPTLHRLLQDSYSWPWGSLKEVLNTLSWTWADVKTSLTIKVLNSKFFPKLELILSFNGKQ